MSGVEPRWEETWRLLGREAPPGILEALVERHAESHRHYHTIEHVEDCLEKARRSRSVQRRPGVVELALWFHDAVYDPRRSDNEVRSAELAATMLSSAVSDAMLAGVRRLVLDTRHRGEPGSEDGAVVVDVDLSIFGESPEVFDAYGEAIRREYSWVPSPVYRRRRARLLERFLARERIFRTEWFGARYEEQARANLERALAKL